VATPNKLIDYSFLKSLLTDTKYSLLKSFLANLEYFEEVIKRIKQTKLLKELEKMQEEKKNNLREASLHLKLNATLIFASKNCPCPFMNFKNRHFHIHALAKPPYALL